MIKKLLDSGGYKVHIIFIEYFLIRVSEEREETVTTLSKLKDV